MIKNYDNTLYGQYIRDIENSDSIGFFNGKWYAPSSPKFDKNNRGMGVDIIFNKKAANVTKGRKGKWLTEQEERDFRNQHIEYINDVYNRNIKSVLSPTKEYLIKGLLYRGDGGDKFWNGNLYQSILSGTDEDALKEVISYYRSKGLNNRTERTQLFYNKHNKNNRTYNKRNTLSQQLLIQPQDNTRVYIPPRIAPKFNKFGGIITKRRFI